MGDFSKMENKFKEDIGVLEGVLTIQTRHIQMQVQKLIQADVDLKAEITRNSGEIKSLKDKHRLLVQENDKLKRKHDVLVQRNNELNEKYDVLDNENNKLKEKHDKLVEKFETFKKNQTDELEKARSSIEKYMKNHSGSFQLKIEKLLGAEKDARMSANTAYKKQLEEIKSHLNGVEEMSSNKTKELETNLLSEVGSLRNMYNLLSGENDKLKEKHSSLVDENNKLIEKHDKLIEENKKNKRNQTAELEKALSSIEKNMKNQSGSFQLKIEKLLGAEKDARMSTNTAYEKQLEEIKSHLNSVEVKSSNQTKERETELLSEVESFKQVLDMVLGENENHRAKYDELVLENKKLAEKYDMLDKENERSKDNQILFSSLQKPQMLIEEMEAKASRREKQLETKFLKIAEAFQNECWVKDKAITRLSNEIQQKNNEIQKTFDKSKQAFAIVCKLLTLLVGLYVLAVVL